MATSKGTQKKKAAPVAKKMERDFNPSKMYQFESNGIAPSMAKGMRYKVTGVLAGHFMKMGFGKIID